jgi:hypothetical protein
MKVKKITPVLLLLAMLFALAPAASARDDKSFSTVVKHMQTNYRAKRQGFFGAVMFARFLVKMIKPAGVKNFKVVMLKELDYSRSPAPQTREFHTSIQNQINGDLWQPLIQFASPRQKQWTYVYAQRTDEDVKMLIVTLQQQDAFVIQFKFSPDRLAQFINDPKIMGISLKGNDAQTQANRPGPNPVDASKPGPEINKDESGADKAAARPPEARPL